MREQIARIRALICIYSCKCAKQSRSGESNRRLPQGGQRRDSAVPTTPRVLGVVARGAFHRARIHAPRWLCTLDALLIRHHAVRDRYWLSAAATTTATTATTASITQRLVFARIEILHVAQ
jgi:hypothetical protein